MTTLSEQVAKLEAELAELKNKLDVEESDKPKLGDVYWTIDAFGRIKNFEWYNNDIDNRGYTYGLTHLTFESAEKEQRRLLAHAKFKRLANGFVPDWKNKKQSKYYTYKDSDDDFWYRDETRCYHIPNVVYFKSAQDRDAAIDAMGAQMEDLL
jgi:hypothetical protein